MIWYKLHMYHIRQRALFLDHKCSKWSLHLKLVSNQCKSLGDVPKLFVFSQKFFVQAPKLSDFTRSVGEFDFTRPLILVSIENCTIRIQFGV